mmetsp:Transcript_46628/g.71298  ORF Transcript_46628/g.71298 Transcript_46628/m.71298 type:complete len:157 (+) Transcript_46628:190-660(+)|eukprot:CAMPEP_0117028316 /NCGR_PEP_ID=MMETSP0472-20121206/20600_1 /TAXON_ID=693140 ORGANISM="Tiarina fusus, Strain LIS" /NCGR_SAMPLE_ID=MMETSP0472 /ASSEMBLY_ACC=CAM_ASM_000603 /LENGTH=156 /DNA_ID=CAMNT_0004735771 /DNA_START=181 /DNA_END=651 /DNA_ORIENTATION=+
MNHSTSKMEHLSSDIVLALHTHSMGGDQNILSVKSDGTAFFQLSYPREESFQVQIGDGVESFLRASLPPLETFLSLGENYYCVPSLATCGTAANLLVKIGDKEHWVGIWNYGRGEIPDRVDAGMYRAVEELAEDLKTSGKGKPIPVNEMWKRVRMR